MPRLTKSEIESALPHYEGLFYTTARRIEGVVELPFDDIKSELRIKAWKALKKFDSCRSTVSRDVYVYYAVMNKKKDILRDDKGRKRTLVSIEDMGSKAQVTDANEATVVSTSGSHNDLRYFSVGSESVYADIEREVPLIPSTLTEIEKHVLVMIYDEHTVLEIQRAVGLKRQEVKDAIERIQLKFSDWRPDGAEQQHLQAA